MEQWIKPLPKVPPDELPQQLHLSGGPGHFTGQTFHKLRRKGRFLVFVFPENKTGHGLLGSIIEIGPDGGLPRHMFLNTLEPKPTTIDELVEQIRRVMSKPYQEELIARLQDTDLNDPQRAEAARRLGALGAVDAWEALEAQATQPGTDVTAATVRESLRALHRVDEARAVPICLKIIRESQDPEQVNTAVWLLMLAREQWDEHAEVFDIFLEATLRWQFKVSSRRDYRPLPNLIRALAETGEKTPEVEQIIMRGVQKGRNNVLAVSMSAAAQLKMYRAVPTIYGHLISGDKSDHVDLEGSASQAFALFVNSKFNGHRPLTEDEAKQAAASSLSRLAQPTPERHGSRSPQQKHESGSRFERPKRHLHRCGSAPAAECIQIQSQGSSAIRNWSCGIAVGWVALPSGGWLRLSAAYPAPAMTS